MARTADKPGSWRVFERGGVYVLSGVDSSGNRVKLRKNSRTEAETLGATLFGAKVAEAPVTVATQSSGIGPIPATFDDWGFPVRMTGETVASVQQSFGLGSNPLPVIKAAVVPDKEADDKKVRRAKQAKSLMELAGISFAAGDVWLARRVVTNLGKEPVNPNPRQVNDLAECTKETLSEWFGDREVKPWQMMFLLAIGIPLSMLIQSPKRKDESEPSKLKSVP